jgi:hypothetical protein
MVEVAFGQFARMGPVVKREEASSPMDIGLFGAAVVIPVVAVYHA